MAYGEHLIKGSAIESFKAKEASVLKGALCSLGDSFFFYSEDSCSLIDAEFFIPKGGPPVSFSEAAPLRVLRMGARLGTRFAPDSIR